MKNILRVSIIAVALALVSCGGGNPQPEGPIDVAPDYTVDGISFKMTTLEGGFFSMGMMQTCRRIDGGGSIHEVMLDGYAIMDQPVSQALWKAVMGNNPASVQNDNLPVDKVTYKDAVSFAGKLSKKLGLNFVLPTEAMYEYAVYTNAIVPDKNLTEWVSDYWTDADIKDLQYNYAGPEKGSNRVARTTLARKPVAASVSAGALGFRLAVVNGKKAPVQAYDALEGRVYPEKVCSREIITAGKVSFTMLPVEGGTYTKGDNSGKRKDYPPMEVSVESFELAQTEVTAGLWLEVMGYLPAGNYTNLLDRPVVNVSWYRAQEFILKLNTLTGRHFRLPTENEWEFAARGGKLSRGYAYSGSEYPRLVAVDSDTSVKGAPADVMSKAANELGFYDMSGNVWEWTQEQFIRGGSASSPYHACTVFNSSPIPPVNVKGTFGFRLAL